VSSSTQAPPTGMAGGGPPASAAEAWDRFNLVWHGLFVATLVLPTTAVLVSLPSVRVRLVCLGLSAAFGLWYYVVLVRHPQWWERPVPMVVYWCGATAFTTALAGEYGVYTILLYSQYPLMFVTLSWWALIPIAGLTAAVGWRLEIWGSGWDAVLQLFMTTALSAMIGLLIYAIAAQSVRRRDALEALEATRAELAATARHAGVLEERQRLAREIHDTLAQGLASIVTQLEAADQHFDDDPEQARRHLDHARRSAREGLGEVRRSVRDLRPDLLDGGSLVDALARACRAWSVDTGILAQLHTTGVAVPLHPDTETTLLRTTQEALANTAKHARATRVTVTLSYLDDGVTLDIDDDGVGFADPPRPHHDGGFGLAGMRERVGAIGGELHVESARGSGTTIAVSVPT
jgi:signal transduction histidine kinase